MDEGSENPSAALSRDYVRIPSVHPDPDYEEVVTFLVKEARAEPREAHPRHQLAGPGARAALRDAELPHGRGPGVPRALDPPPLLRPHGRGAQHLREGDAGHEVCGDHASGGTVTRIHATSMMLKCLTY